MIKYLLRRLLHGLFSIVCVVGIVMFMIYSLMDRQLVFASDTAYQKQRNNDKTQYMYEKLEKYGYLDYVSYNEYLIEITKAGEIDEDTRAQAVLLSKGTADEKTFIASDDNSTAKQYIAQFVELYESQGYEIQRLKTKYKTKKIVADGGNPRIFAIRDRNLISRLWNYFTHIFTLDNIHNAEEVVGERGISFTWHDPVYGGEKFSPAIMGNGTQYRYLLYFDNKFPFIHQNILHLNLGVSYSVNQGVEIFTTMTQPQDPYTVQDTYYPTGVVEQSYDNLHTLQYVPGSNNGLNIIYARRYTDDYTYTESVKAGASKMGNSFIIGIISTLIAYLIGVPVGVSLARHKDGIADKIGMLYIIFIIAVPSLAYIFMFKMIGGTLFGLPTTFFTDDVHLAQYGKLIYVLPIISLALPSIAGLMKWIRRYMIDQMNSDYVKFARSGGLSENEIFTKHILKNASIPIIHGIPGDLFGALVGAIITERIYVVPGVGNVLTKAINQYDNSVIVGVTLFYAILSVVAIILGDILMAIVDPRISFSSSGR